ncbi:helix-turn-helix domain-containing protein [Anaerosalibacter sp. Marseille-P3206]|uniref:helix-turn-helix domain-containing protein n=1 Tax=Anaerosalibacter sp. Marseille-P3206 TaxID=1871005 RepID=UPI000985384C|nr:helix-turn-helix transcriptional regulator [Anaerosalibacter sp. Marseille-P3206]
MYCNLQNFGEEIRSIRTNLGFTKKYVCEISGIHEDTLRNIENGRAIPMQKTLDLLSPILKKDLNKLLLDYRLNNYSALEKIKNTLESKIDRNEFETLSEELNNLKALSKIESNSYFVDLIEQYILLIESIILNKKYNKINESLDKLVEAIKITTDNFSIDNYNNFVYSSIEIRILMNIALLISKFESTEKSLEIMNFCMKSVKPNEELYPKICYYLSYTYHNLNIHKNALKYSDLGIKYCMQYRNYNGLNLLYFRKAIAEYLLGYKSYIAPLKKCIYFCEVLEQYELRDLLMSNCKKLYNIDI